MRLRAAPCDKVNIIFSSSEAFLRGGLARSSSLNEVMKLELCSLISRGSWSVTCGPWSLYFFLITSLCFIIQGSTSWICCSVTRLALSKSMPRPSKLTCISWLPSWCPHPSILPKCLLRADQQGSRCLDNSCKKRCTLRLEIPSLCFHLDGTCYERIF